MKKLFTIVTIIVLFSVSLFAVEKKQLIFYCGITMVKPMTEIAKIIEKKHNVKISISQGGSKDLLDSLIFSKKGDLFLPGSESYLINNKNQNLFDMQKLIGYNKAAIFVQKGNPKNITVLDDLFKTNTNTMLCDDQAGSIGRESKKILVAFNGEEYYYDLFDRAISIGTDSRNLNKSLKDKTIDATINWKSTAFFPENINFIDVIDIDEKYAKPKKLVIARLAFSENKDIANDFIEFTASKEGQEIMRNYGF